MSDQRYAFIVSINFLPDLCGLLKCVECGTKGRVQIWEGLDFMLHIVTDTASDITGQQAEEMGIDLVSLTITFEDGVCFQGNEENFAPFYEKLKGSDILPKTSRPSPELYLKIFERAKAAGDEVLVLTISGGLSGTAESARLAKEMAGYERIYVVDTHQAIIAQRMLVEYALKLCREQVDIEEIVRKIEEVRDQIVVCGVVDTLVYLKKGGRIPAGLAVLGEALHIKPVIVLEDRILKTMAKVRGRKAGIDKLYDRVEHDGIDPDFPVYFGYTSNRGIVADFMKETEAKYQLNGRCSLYPIGGIIGTHCGTDCIAIAYKKQKKGENGY